MKVNKNKMCFLGLCGICIGFTIVLFSILLLTDYEILQYLTLTLAFLEGIYVVYVLHKYPTMIQKQRS